MDRYTRPPEGETGLAATSARDGVTYTAERRGPFAPRLLLLAAIFYHPAILIAYLLYLYGPGNACVVGSLCGFGGFPPLVQALTILAGCALLWLALYTLVYRLVGMPGSEIGAFLRDLSAYPLIAPLLRIYGFVLLVGLLLALLARHLTIPALIVGGFGTLVCFYCASAGARLTAPPGSGGRA